MPEIKLSPCPFCGSVPHFKQKSNCCTNTSKVAEFIVYCQGCGIEFPQKFTFKIEFDLESIGGIKVLEDERPKAVEAWNRRAKNETD